jgi:hypothetical protein
MPRTAGLFFGPMASDVPSFTSRYVGSKSSKHALVVRFRNAQADRIRVSCSRPRTAFVGSSCRRPRPSRNVSRYTFIWFDENSAKIKRDEQKTQFLRVPVQGSSGNA